MKIKERRKTVDVTPFLPEQECLAKLVTNPDTGAKEKGMTVREHSVTVGYVAKALTKTFGKDYRKVILRSTPILAALHDIGKLSPGFIVKIMRHLGMFKDVILEMYCTLHAEVSEAELADVFPYLAPGKPFNQYKRMSGMIGAHHGKYNKHHDPSISHRYGGERWSRSRREMIDEMVALFGGFSKEKVTKKKAIGTLALITIADHIASDERLFDQRGGLTDEEIRIKAEAVVAEMQWGQFKVRMDLTFQQIFGNEFRRFSPNDVQVTVEAVAAAMDGKPGIIIIEDATGNGKTESALWAAYVALSRGFKGFYFGLPTRLTSNSIRDRRATPFVENAMEMAPDVRLIHGQAWYLPRQQGSNLLRPTHRWFTPNRRAILAPFGVGTIDQPLMGVLNLKFNYLRQFGMYRKVVIIDEVHTYDAYTSGILRKFVRECVAMDCLVVVLSATLTREAKAKLLNCDEHALSIRKGFPTVTYTVKSSKPRELFPNQSAPSKRVDVRYSPRSHELILEAARLAKAGANVLWVENSVPEAAESYASLKKECPGIQVSLLHSRYIPPRRGRLENEWLTLMGPNQSNRPAGCILVSTQVAEQSIDVDFDVLFTALCPSDFLIQRMGRIWRHANRRPPFLLRPLAFIIGPDPSGLTDAAKVSAGFGLSALIYDRFVMLRSALIWGEMGEVVLPDQTRNILERTYKKPRKSDPKVILELNAIWVEKKRTKAIAAALATTDHGAASPDRETDELLAEEQDAEDALDPSDVDVGDDKRPSSRYASVPTVQLVLCRSISFSTSEMMLELYDGQAVRIPMSRLEIGERSRVRSAAVSITQNSVRVPVSRPLSFTMGIEEDPDRTVMPLSNAVFGRSRAVIWNPLLHDLRLEDGTASGYSYDDEFGALRS